MKSVPSSVFTHLRSRPHSCPVARGSRASGGYQAKVWQPASAHTLRRVGRWPHHMQRDSGYIAESSYAAILVAQEIEHRQTLRP